MSVYPPPSHLQQAPYPHPAFPSISLQYGYPQPVQQPIPYFSDSIQFRQFYAHKLRGLTENSKPAIHGLSMIAQDFARWADVVVQCIENHIRRVSVLFPPTYLTQSGLVSRATVPALLRPVFYSCKTTPPMYFTCKIFTHETKKRTQSCASCFLPSGCEGIL